MKTLIKFAVASFVLTIAFACEPEPQPRFPEDKIICKAKSEARQGLFNP